MAVSAGWAALPVNLSFQDSIKGLVKELNGPVAKAAKSAGESLESGIGKGADAAAQAVEKAQYRVKKSTQELADAQSKLTQETAKQKAADLELEQAAKELAAARESGGEAAVKAEVKYERAQARAEAAANAARKAQEKLKDAQEESARAAKRLADAEEAAKNGLENIAAEADDTTAAFGGLDGVVGTAGESLKKFGGLAAGFVGIAGFGELVSTGLEFDNTLNKMQNSLGLSADAAAQMGDEVQAVMGSGLTSSAEEAAAAVGALNSQFGHLGSEGEQTAAELADNFLGFSQTFGVEMSEATQMAGQLVTNGLAVDVEDAADLMTTAMQRVPEAMRGELPEIMAEYGTNFRALGFEGEEAFAVLVNASQRGKFALDKTGDALKEFTIRGSDMSTTSVEAFESIGLNAEEMANKIASGGDGARDALQKTAQELLAIEDPATRANTAIALFGTPLEDLSVDQIPQFLEGLTGAENSMAGFEGASQAVSDNIAGSLQGRIDTLKGTVSGLAADGFMMLWDAVEFKVVPAFQTMGDWVQRNSDWLEPLGVTLGIVTAGLTGMAIQQQVVAAGGLVQWVTSLTAATRLQTGAQAAFNLVMNANPIALVVTAVAALAAGLVYFFTKTETGKAAWQSMVDGLGAGWQWVDANVIKPFGAGITWLGDWIGVKVEGIKAFWSGLGASLDAGRAFVVDTVFGGMRSGLDSLKGFFGSIVDGIGATWNGLRALLAKPVNFMIGTVYNDGILRAWNVIAGLLPGLEPGEPLAQIPAFACGGRISGPGTGTSDDVLMWGSNGEHVLTAADVERMGGHKAVYAMRDALYQGRGFTFDGKKLAVLPGSIDNRAGDLAGAAPQLIPAFKDGGEVRPLWEMQLMRAHEFAKSQHGKPYQWAGPTGPGSSFDCSGFMGAIAATIQGTNPWQRYWATGSFSGGNTAQGFVPGLGPGFSIGLFNGGPWGGHTAGTLGPAGPYSSVNVESGGSPSMVKYGPGAVGADNGQFTHQYHLPIGADGGFITGGNGISPEKMREVITEKISGAVDKVLSPIEGLLPSPPPQWQGIPAGVFEAGKGKFEDAISEKIDGLSDRLGTVFAAVNGMGDLLRGARQGIGNWADAHLFDSGGVWKSGQVGVNLSGADEYVFTNKAMKNFTLSTDSLAVAAKEITEAYHGGDWGYGELAAIFGSERVGKAIVDIAAGVGEFNREYGPALAQSAQGYAVDNAKSALGMVGLDPLVDMGMNVAGKAWDAYQRDPWHVGVSADGVYAASRRGRIAASGGAGGATVIIEAESDDDLVRAGQLKQLAGHVHGLEVQLRAPRRPKAAATTKGGVM